MTATSNASAACTQRSVDILAGPDRGDRPAARRPAARGRTGAAAGAGPRRPIAGKSVHVARGADTLLRIDFSHRGHHAPRPATAPGRRLGLAASARRSRRRGLWRGAVGEGAVTTWLTPLLPRWAPIARLTPTPTKPGKAPRIAPRRSARPARTWGGVAQLVRAAES